MIEASAVDLFCGAGGLTYGLEEAGISVNAGIDIDPSCRYPYEANTEATFVEKSIRNLEPAEVETLYPEDHVKILVGCAPCQPFSSLRQKREDNEKDEKWDLLNCFGDIIEGVNPSIVSMENVPKLRKQDIFEEFLETLEENGYESPYWDVVYCPKYGVPQERSRLVLLASKLGEIELKEPKFDNPEEYKTVGDAIKNLEPIEAGEQSEEDPLHKATNLQKINLKRIRESKPGGTWKDWPEELKLECHKKNTGRSYTPVYGRMEWDKPAPTITTQCYNYGSGRFGHPEQDRAISLREAALIQTFPKDYKFVKDEDEIRFERLGKLIGNSVPVKLAEVIGESIKIHLENHSQVICATFQSV